MNRSSILHIAAALIDFFALTAPAATYYASPNGAADATCTADDPGSIAAALALAVGADSWENGDTIVFQDGRYAIPTTGYAKFAYTVDKPFLTLRSASGKPEQVLLVGGNTNAPGAALNITGPARIEGLSFTNFVASRSGFVMTCNSSDDGGVMVSNCVFQNNLGVANSTKHRAGMVYGGTYLDCRFLYNTNQDYTFGGGAIAYGTAVDCTFIGNSANRGGALYGTSATNCLFQDNYASYNGAIGGGAVYLPTGGSLVDCTFYTNAAYAYGGAAQASGDCLAENCTFIGNISSKPGAALCNISSVNCRFVGNKGGGSGGGVVGGGGHTNAIVIGNTAYQGVLSGTYVDSLIISNNSYHVFNGFSAIRCRIEGNTSDYALFASAGRLVDCLLISNAVSRARPFLAAPCINCTFVGNKVGGTLGVVSGSVTTNCLFYGNRSPDMTGGTHFAALYQNASSGAVLSNGCQRITDCPFAGASRPDAPYQPLRKSSAIDAGIAIDSAEVLEADFYGRGRVNGLAIDIGCAERWPLYPATHLELR